jgi:hypothetical protein
MNFMRRALALDRAHSASASRMPPRDAVPSEAGDRSRRSGRRKRCASRPPPGGMARVPTCGMSEPSPDGRGGGGDGGPQARRGATSSSPAAPDAEAAPAARNVVLLCNPLARGRWRALADVLDSPEARLVRRIVTDEIDDLGAALATLGQRVDLLCIYGGDGTVFGVLNQLALQGERPPRLAIIGGGTMNVTARACGMGRSPVANFRTVMRAYLADRLTWREIPLLSIADGAQTRVGFIFSLGPIVRLLAQYELGRKGAAAAAVLAARGFGDAVLGFGGGSVSLEELRARVRCDGVALPYLRYAAIFCNTTGMVNPYVRPFLGERDRESFHFLAYAASSRSVAVLAPLLARGHLPLDPHLLRSPVSSWRRAVLSYLGGGQLPADPRYVNHPARAVSIETDEPHYTIDGEILATGGRTLEVRLGPPVRAVIVDAHG